MNDDPPTSDPRAAKGQAPDVELSIGELVLDGLPRHIAPASMERAFRRELGRLLGAQSLPLPASLRREPAARLELAFTRTTSSEQFGQRLAQTIHAGLIRP